MALSGSLPQINLGVQGETQGVSTVVPNVGLDRDPKRCRGRIVKESSRQYGWITNFVHSSSSPRLKLPRTTHSRAKGRS
ncbi:hypothetical protein TNCV_4738561 [Trichonephila clavipes]|nr:hypothetical protein TNCV_4738561 [Trichonephila clavipes]